VTRETALLGVGDLVREVFGAVVLTGRGEGADHLAQREGPLQGYPDSARRDRRVEHRVAGDQDGRMRPYLMLSVADVVSERPAGADDDVHFTEALVVAVFEEYTAPGDRVLDAMKERGLRSS
jgi:hypothetical protein